MICEIQPHKGAEPESQDQLDLCMMIKARKEIESKTKQEAFVLSQCANCQNVRGTSVGERRLRR